MSSKKYNCSLCLYNTDKKFNFNRHMVLKHSINETNETNEIKETNETNETNEIKEMSLKKYNCSLCLYNTKIKVKFNRHMVLKHSINETNETNDNQCIKCNKILSSKNYLNKHLIICKGVSNPLECHLCHKLYFDSSSKSRHLKKCKGKLIEDVKNDDEKNEQNTKDNISSFKLKVINKTIEFIKSIANLSEDDE